MAVQRSSLSPRRPSLGAFRRERELFRVPHVHFWCDSEDGIRLAGTILGESETDTAIVVAHGFMGYRQKVKNRRLAEALSVRHRVYAFDMRGHGESGGACTGGAVEHLDVEAVVTRARADGFSRVVTVGWSLGGIAVVRHAAMYGGVDAVVAISTPHRWGGETKAVRRTTWLFTTALGRAIAHRMMRTRIDLRLDMPDPPGDVVGKIAPTPILIVHGADDHFFGPDAAIELFEAAGDPKRLLVIEGFGHAEDGFTGPFAARLAGEIDTMLA